MTQKELMAELAAKVAAAEAALKEATDFADLHKLEFYFAPTYGMGGTYRGDATDRWNDAGWSSSSSDC